MGKIYIGDIGTDILLDVGKDITGATVGISVRKPSGSTTTWGSSVYDSTYVRHVTESGDLDESGIYYLQPSISTADGAWSGLGATAELKVFNKYQ